VGRLIYSMSVSLDGFVETPSRSLDWVLVDDELHAVFNDEARAMGAFLYGRRMYELMVAYWPTAETDPSATPVMREFARIWRDKPKIVFSRTLERVDWNSRWSAMTPRRRSPGSRRSRGSTWTSRVPPPPRR
jgi:dihydrofolate reductase